MYPPLLLHVPTLLASEPQLEGDVVAEVELLFAGEVVGAVQVLYRVVQAVLLQQSLAFRGQRGSQVIALQSYHHVTWLRHCRQTKFLIHTSTCNYTFLANLLCRAAIPLSICQTTNS